MKQVIFYIFFFRTMSLHAMFLRELTHMLIKDCPLKLSLSSPHKNQLCILQYFLLHSSCFHRPPKIVTNKFSQPYKVLRASY